MKSNFLKIFLLLLFALTLVFCSSENEFGGLGIEVPARDLRVSSGNPYTIISVFEGTPAYSANLQPGDIIVSVDGRDLRGLNEKNIFSNLLRGKPGTVAVLEILRIEEDGLENRFIVQLMRSRIVVQE